MKRTKIIVSVVVVFAMILSITSMAFAASRNYELTNLNAGGGLWSGGTVMKATTDKRGYCKPKEWTSGSSMECRLYKNDKTTQAMADYIVLNSNQPNYKVSGPITVDVNLSYEVYMTFTTSGSTTVKNYGTWGTSATA